MYTVIYLSRKKTDVATQKGKRCLTVWQRTKYSRTFAMRFFFFLKKLQIVLYSLHGDCNELCTSENVQSRTIFETLLQNRLKERSSLTDVNNCANFVREISKGMKSVRYTNTTRISPIDTMDDIPGNFIPNSFSYDT